MTFFRCFAFAATLLVGTAPTHAASIDINGVWGNRGGCEYARGIYRSDTAVLLRRDRLEGTEFQCDFRSARRGSDGSFTVQAACAQEGEAARVRITIGPERNGTRSIRADKGWRFGDVRQCRP